MQNSKMIVLLDFSASRNCYSIKHKEKIAAWKVFLPQDIADLPFGKITSPNGESTQQTTKWSLMPVKVFHM